MVFGTYALRHVAKRKGWTPGSFDLGHLTYQDHVARWGDHMLNGDAVFCRFDRVLERLPEGMVEFFIRPVGDSKFFAGMMTTRGQFEDWARGVVALGEDDGSGLRAGTEVMFCAEKVIRREYRLWVVDEDIVTASLYKQGDRVLHAPEVEDDVLAFGRARVQEWSPARAYAVDVARLGDGSLKIVETNTINAAGFYAADVARLVGALEAMTF